MNLLNDMNELIKNDERTGIVLIDILLDDACDVERMITKEELKNVRDAVALREYRQEVSIRFYNKING